MHHARSLPGPLLQYEHTCQGYTGSCPPPLAAGALPAAAVLPGPVIAVAHSLVPHSLAGPSGAATLLPVVHRHTAASRGRGGRVWRGRGLRGLWRPWWWLALPVGGIPAAACHWCISQRQGVARGLLCVPVRCSSACGVVALLVSCTMKCSRYASGTAACGLCCACRHCGLWKPSTPPHRTAPPCTAVCSCAFMVPCVHSTHMRLQLVPVGQQRSIQGASQQ
jgi:hypothetical protein